MYAVEAARPCNTSDPVVEAQLAGLFTLDPLMLGVGLIVTLAVPAAEVQLPSVAVTVYEPVAATVTLEIEGFCWVLVNALGPFHAQVITPGVVVEAVRFKVLLEQTGLLLPAVGVTGVWLIVTFVVPAAEVQPLIVTVTL